MTSAQPDKTGLHILLKLAALVVILAGIHAAADIIVQLLLALFFAIVLNPLVTWFIRRGLRRPIAITLVVVVMLFVLTALVGVLASSITEFMDMLPKYNKELTRKVLYVQEMVPFLNLHMSPERLLQRIDSDKLMTFTTTLMTGLSGAMASVFLLVMTVVFMLFEVRHVPYKLRFALNNPQIHIAGLHRALKGVSHYLALKTLLSLWTGAIVWLGLALMGIQFALMWGVLAFLLNYVPNIGSHAAGAAVQRDLRMRAGRRPVSGRTYGDWQYPRAAYDGPSFRPVDACCLPVLTGMGMAARSGRHVTFRAAYQRV